MAIKEIQIHQLPEVDKINNDDVFVIEENYLISIWENLFFNSTWEYYFFCFI